MISSENQQSSSFTNEFVSTFNEYTSLSESFDELEDFDFSPIEPPPSILSLSCELMLSIFDHIDLMQLVDLRLVNGFFKSKYTKLICCFLNSNNFLSLHHSK